MSLTLEQIQERIRQHRAKDVSFNDSNWKAHAKERWRLHLLELDAKQKQTIYNFNGETHGSNDI